MIKVPYHLGLVQWQCVLTGLCAEQTTIVGHVDHAQERHLPRVDASPLIYQNQRISIDFFVSSASCLVRNMGQLLVLGLIRMKSCLDNSKYRTG